MEHWEIGSQMLVSSYSSRYAVKRVSRESNMWWRGVCRSCYGSCLPEIIWTNHSQRVHSAVAAAKIEQKLDSAGLNLFQLSFLLPVLAEESAAQPEIYTCKHFKSTELRAQYRRRGRGVRQRSVNWKEQVYASVLKSTKSNLLLFGPLIWPFQPHQQLELWRWLWHTNPLHVNNYTFSPGHDSASDSRMSVANKFTQKSQKKRCSLCNPDSRKV